MNGRVFGRIRRALVNGYGVMRLGREGSGGLGPRWHSNLRLGLPTIHRINSNQCAPGKMEKFVSPGKGKLPSSCNKLTHDLRLGLRVVWLW